MGRQADSAVLTRFVAALLVLAAMPFLTGWAGSLEEIRDQAAHITAIQARFTQEKHLEILEKPLVSKGAFFFRSPDRLRWEYTRPVKSVLLMDNEQIRQYTMAEDGMQARSGQRLEAMRAFLEQIGMWMQGGFDQSPAFEAELISGRTVVLTPADSTIAGVIEKIELVLTDTPGIIESAIIYEDPSSYTRIGFHETEINPEIPDTVFEQPQ
jgi:outer membrane lipoprotein-sorting protein